jgi:tetratricopeptide (TPR) repeat protein
MPRLLVACALAVVTALAYLPAGDNGFVNYDDDLYIINNPQIQSGLDSESVTWAFTSFHGANWFPLTRLSWMLDSELFGLEPAAFHRTGVLLHIASTLLLFFALVRMTGATAASAFVAGVFGLHPLHVESVAWASSRKDLVSGFFFMLALFFYAGFSRTPASRAPGAADPGRAWRLAAVALCLALGLMAKQMLVTLPFVLLLLDEWPLGRLRGQRGRLDLARVRAAILEKIPLFALAIAASIVVVAAQRSWGTVQSFEVLPFGMRVSNALVATLQYVGAAFWPSGLSPFYPHPGVALHPAWAIGAGALLLGVSAVAVASLRRWPPFAVGWFWFLGTLVPVLGLVQVGQAARADRYMYLPLIGLSLPVAFGLGALADRGRAPRIAAGGIAVAATLSLGLATHAQVERWRSSVALFQHALEVTSGNHVAHMNLGLALHREGRPAAAVPHLLEAVRLVPESPMAHGLLGELRLGQERWREAESHLRSALEGRRDAPRWHAGLGAALLGQERIPEAIESLERAVEGRPRTAPLRVNLGVALVRAGEFERAVAVQREAIAIDPELAEAHLHLGVALMRLGRPRDAVEALSRASSLDPTLGAARSHLAGALEASGDRASALLRTQEALALDPDSGELHALHGRTLEASGRVDEAVVAYRRALALGVRSPVLLNNLAWLLASGSVSADDPSEAVRLAEEAADATGRRSAAILDTLAVAYAAATRPAEARTATREAMFLAEEAGDHALAAELQRRLATLEDPDSGAPEGPDSN